MWKTGSEDPPVKKLTFLKKTRTNRMDAVKKI